MSNCTKSNKEHRALMKMIYSIQGYVRENVKNPNDGGCGHFAWRMAKSLKKLGIKNEIKLDCGYGSISKKRKLLTVLLMPKSSPERIRLIKFERDDELMYLSARHAYLYLPEFDIYFDSENVQIEGNVFYPWANNGKYTIKEMKESLAYGNWNKMYNHRKYNRKFDYIIAKTAKEFIKETSKALETC